MTVDALGTDPTMQPDPAVLREPDPRPDPDRRPLRRLPLLVLSVLAALLLSVVVVLAFQVRSQQDTDAARQQALAAARQSAINLTTIDVASFDAAVKRVLDGATSTFRDEYRNNSGELKTLLTQNKVTSVGQIIDAGLVRSDASTATALVVIDATVKNTEVPDGRVNTYRMQIDVEKVGDRWLTSTLQFVG